MQTLVQIMIKHRRSRSILLIWFIATLISSASMISAWTLHIDGFNRAISNLFYMIALPGWIPIYALGFSGIRDQPIAIIAASSLSWLFWIWIVSIAVRVHGRLHSNARGDRSERPSPPESPSRRAFIGNAVLGVGAIGAATSPTYATLIEPWAIKVRSYTIPIRGLPRSLENLRLVQFSDSHLGPRMPASFIKHAADLVVQLEPDIVLLTGDYVHDGVDDIEQAAELCKPMIEAANIATVGVLGNHDWWGDGRRMSKALQAHGVHMIDNDRVWIDPDSRSLSTEKRSNALALVGLGDLTEDIVDPIRAFRDVDQLTPRVVLAHHPDTAEQPELIRQNAPRIDLMVSGHTHGGQVRLPLLGTPLVPSEYGSKYAGGLVQGPAFPVLISRGVGLSLLPVRFGVPPELVEITLVRA